MNVKIGRRKYEKTFGPTSGFSSADLNVIRREHYVANEVREYDTYSTEMLKKEGITDYTCFAWEQMKGAL